MTEPTLLQNLFNRYEIRQRVLNLKGRTRDNDCIAYFVGAANGLALAGDADGSDFIGRWTSLCLAFRGYKEIEKKLAEARASGVVFQEIAP